MPPDSPSDGSSAFAQYAQVSLDVPENPANRLSTERASSLERWKSAISKVRAVLVRPVLSALTKMISVVPDPENKALTGLSGQ